MSLSRLSGLYWTAAFSLPIAGAALADRHPTATVPSMDGAALFHSLEDRLLKTDTVRLSYRATAAGATAAKLGGQIAVQSNNRVRVDLTGEFRKPASMTFVSDGRSMSLSGSVPAQERPTAPDLRGSIIVGLLRMGALHNLARLANGQAPDRADGTVQQWVEVSGFEARPPEVVNGVDAQPLSFRIVVAGHDTGQATLWLRLENGLPLKRAQTVQLPAGEMRVVEEYERFEVGQPLERNLFERGK